MFRKGSRQRHLVARQSRVLPCKPARSSSWARACRLPNAEIYGENEPADYLYKVVSGTVRTYKVLVDGRRQIGAFHLPGDIFGLETGDVHTFSAETITECKIIVIKRSTVMALAARDNDVARQMWELTACELRRVQEHSLVLIKSAEEL